MKKILFILLSIVLLSSCFYKEEITNNEIINGNDNTVDDSFLSDLQGNYYDTNGSMSEAELSLLNDNTIAFDIYMPISNEEFEEWIMFVKYEDNKLIYDEYLHTKVKTFEGKDYTEILNDSNEGFLLIEDNKISWHEKYHDIEFIFVKK